MTSGQQVVLDEQLTAALGLGLALGGEVDVDPAGEQVLLVPVALAVAKQHEGGGHLVNASSPERTCTPRAFAGTPLIGRSLRSFRFSALTRLRCSLTRIILPKRYGAMPRRVYPGNVCRYRGSRDGICILRD